VREAAPHGGRELRHRLRRAQPIQPRDQRILQRRRNGERGQRAGQLVLVVALAQQLGFEHRLRQLLDEEGAPVGVRDELLEHGGRQPFPGRQLRDHGHAVVPPERRQRDHRPVVGGRPRRTELGAEDEHGEQARHGLAREQQPEQLLRRRVDPVQVLDDEEHRPLARHAPQQAHERLQRPRALALRRQRERRIPVFGQRQREQGRQ
jgi:hypothetical protein